MMHSDTGVYSHEIFIELWSHNKFGLGTGNFRARLYEFLEYEMGIARSSTTAHKILNDVFSTWAPAYLAYFPVETGKEKESALWWFLLVLVTKLVLIQRADADTEESPSSLWEVALSKLSDSNKRDVQYYSVDRNRIRDALQKVSEFLPAESVKWLFSDLYDLLKADSDAISTSHQKYKELMQEQLTNLLFGATKE